MTLTVVDLVAGYDPVVSALITDYFRDNEAARTALGLANRAGRRLAIDHMAIRCHRVDERAGEFLAMGYRSRDELIEYPDQGRSSVGRA